MIGRVHQHHMPYTPAPMLFVSPRNGTRMPVVSFFIPTERRREKSSRPPGGRANKARSSIGLTYFRLFCACVCCAGMMQSSDVPCETTPTPEIALFLMFLHDALPYTEVHDKLLIKEPLAELSTLTLLVGTRTDSTPATLSSRCVFGQGQETLLDMRILFRAPALSYPRPGA